ncbi:hypothetical protein PFISCL1PPCAC_5571, partial [Pristionchus fissidentatus]
DARLHPNCTDSFDDFVYIVGRSRGENGELAVTNWAEDLIRLRGHRFIDGCDRKADCIYSSSLVDTSSAWIYPVEPPKNRVEYAQLTSKIRSSSRYEGTFATEIRPLAEADSNRIIDRLKDFDNFSRDPEDAEKFLARLFELGIRYRLAVTPPEIQSVQILSTDPVRLMTYSIKSRIDAITLLFDDEKIRVEVNDIKRVKGREYHTTITCRSNSQLIKALGKRGDRVDWCDALIHSNQGNILIKHLQKISEDFDGFEDDEAYEKFSAPITTSCQPSLLSSLYGNSSTSSITFPSSHFFEIRKADGKLLKLNERQSKALAIYHHIRQPAYCILSPPGSGKTTVAAAMAASFIDLSPNESKGVQLLLAVQNVAVDNLSESLSTFDDGYLKAYHMKGLTRIDPHSSTPYDIFEELPNYERWMVKADERDIAKVTSYLFDVNPRWISAQNDPQSKLSRKEREELKREWNSAMKAAKSALEKYLEPDIILSTVDLILYRLIGSYHTSGLRGQLWNVDRIIIDEASLLTESAFYCLIRAFPTAKFALIGDDQQLAPFMFDEGILGHELAARSALSVALKKENIPVINLIEVYRAPQSLVQPYNRLSYDGKLESRKIDAIAPLTSAGLVNSGRPQLLFINVRGDSQKGYNSHHNPQELNALIRLLRKFPANSKNDIMIISLYKEQKRRVEREVGTDYEVLTVDSSQGKEKPIVIVLTTRSTQTSDMKFFCCKKRCTVAVSRQQRALIVFGSAPILYRNHPWSTVIGGKDFTRMEADQLGQPLQQLQQRPMQQLQQRPMQQLQ